MVQHPTAFPPHPTAFPTAFPPHPTAASHRTPTALVSFVVAQHLSRPCRDAALSLATLQKLSSRPARPISRSRGGEICFSTLLCVPQTPTKQKGPGASTRQGRPSLPLAVLASVSLYWLNWVWFLHSVRFTVVTTDCTPPPTGVTEVDGNHGGANPPVAKRWSNSTLRVVVLMFWMVF